MDLLRSLYAYNQGAGRSDPIRAVGIDFERPYFYFKALRGLLPADPAPPALEKEIGVIKTTSDSLDCGKFGKIDRFLKKSLFSKSLSFQSYFGADFREVRNIIDNKGSCKDVYKNRNPNLKRRLELFDAILKDSLYYGQLGDAHVNFRLKNFSWLLNNDSRSPFYQKVCVINVYCYHCDSLNKHVSNWAFNKIEDGIRDRFLKYCQSDFTLFDLTESPDPLIAQYRACGQFLLVVKDQN